MERRAMDNEVRERFAEIDTYIEEMNGRLVTIARQNAALAEMVEVLGGFDAPLPPEFP